MIIGICNIRGDGELQEGQVWEAFMSATHFNLDNLVAIVDSNGIYKLMEMFQK